MDGARAPRARRLGARFQGHGYHARDAWGVPEGHRGAGGEKTASAIAKVLGITTDEVFGLPRKRVVLGAPDPDAVHPVLGSRPGANEALARAKRQEPWFPAFAWDDALSTATLIAPAVVTPAMLIAVRAGALTPETLSLRQRFAPHWLLEWRCEVIARAFNSFEVA